MESLRRFTPYVFALALSCGAASAGPLGQGVVMGQMKSNVTVGNVTQTNRASLGYARQELNVGSVNGGKVLGKLELNVHVGNIHQSNRVTVGYSAQETSIGSVK
jgi:hypothetical protein